MKILFLMSFLSLLTGPTSAESFYENFENASCKSYPYKSQSILGKPIFDSNEFVVYHEVERLSKCLELHGHNFEINDWEKLKVVFKSPEGQTFEVILSKE